MRLFRRSLLCLVVGVTLVTAYYFATAPGRRLRGSREAADSAWREKRALRLVREHPVWHTEHKGLRIESRVDQVTGLERGIHGALMGRSPEGSDSYNARIDELLAMHGPPPWSAWKHLLSPDDLAAAFAQADLTKVETLPYEITPSIRLSRSYIRSADPTADRLEVRTQGGSFLMGFGSGASTVLVGRLKGHPDFILVRAGREMSVYTKEGRLLYQIEPTHDHANQEPREVSK